MRLISFTAESRSSYGILTDGGVYDLGRRIGHVVPDLKTYIGLGPLGFSHQPGTISVDYADGEFIYEPVIPNAAKILCIGLNYENHRLETGRAVTENPAVFMRYADSLTGHGQPLIKPVVSDCFDYEGEIAIVIGKAGYRIPKERALEHVAGYACFNDATFRDWSRHSLQYGPGKNFPKSGSFGPALVTPDELPNFADRKIETRLNGQVMQSAVLGDMIFSLERLIEYVSTFAPLSPGDVIPTGTPGGVGFKRVPEVYMQPGDTIEIEVGGVGLLSNIIDTE